MSAPTFTPQLGSPDPSATPLTVTELVTLLNALFLPVSVANYSNQIVSGSGFPSVGDQDKIWFRTDSSGRPLGLYSYYSGDWRPFYSGRDKEIRLYSGAPSTYFDTTGLGKVGLIWDGWAICNGQNGTTDLTDKFIVAAHMNGSGGIAQYGGSGWQTNVDTVGGGNATGGAPNHSVIETDLPSYDPVFIGAEYAAGTPQSLNHFIIDNNWVSYGQSISGTYAGLVHYGAPTGGTQTKIPTLPPYFALAYTQFVGY